MLSDRLLRKKKPHRLCNGLLHKNNLTGSVMDYYTKKHTCSVMDYYTKKTH